MSSRRLGSLLAGMTLGGSAVYLFVYLYRWEWNRAIIAGVFLLAAEVALATVAVLNRLAAMETSPPPRAAGSSEVLARVREAAPPARDHFAWLQPGPDRLGVFVPILMGAGFVLSALAWAVEKVARTSARPVLERGLAARLSGFSLPEDGLVPAAGAGDDHLALLLGPSGGGRR